VKKEVLNVRVFKCEFIEALVSYDKDRIEEDGDDSCVRYKLNVKNSPEWD